MNLRIRLLKLIKALPNSPFSPYCRKHLSYLSYAAMSKKGCLSKRGLLRKPCEYLTWLRIDRVSCWPPIEPALLSRMGWKVPTSTFEEQLRDLGFKGAMPRESEEA
jgi:hypothetical protein